ncbi:hypothetical protein [Leucobacter chromiiresistens]|uniref:hypothetical protein n=1 Tax=Leucobacter chromiiresistens TaxID=1079994 RepID=UPI0006815823|nr:hypothetical protein [Leucobacter chromiiresistens]
MPPTPPDHPRSRAGWAVLRVLLVLESLLLVGVLIFSVSAALGSVGPVAQNVSIVAMALLALVWVAVTAVAALRGRPSWVRGSALTIHVLLFAAGTGCLQLGIGSWQFGFSLVAGALVGFAAAVLARPDERPVYDEEGRAV